MNRSPDRALELIHWIWFGLRRGAPYQMNTPNPLPKCFTAQNKGCALGANRLHRVSRRFALCGLTTFVSTTLLACAPKVDGDHASGGTAVSIRNVQFYPATVEVNKGGMVEWKNDDLIPHTATAPSFDSGSLAAGQTWRHTFTEAGTFPYICTFHPPMKGVVIVK